MKSRDLLPSLILVLLGWTTLIAQESPAVEVKLPGKEKFHLFLLVGQSNMAGRGKLTAEDMIANPRVLTLDKSGNWVPAVDPIHFDKPKVVGVGLGRTFGLEVAGKNPDNAIGLIPCAVGGSPIASWQPGALDQATKTHPYDDALQRARAALHDGTLHGILWHQGEADSSPEKSAVYQEKLHALIARFRHELNAPEVPFIAGQLGQFPERPWNDAKRHVDQVHRELPEKVPHAAFVSSDGLTHRGDNIHFSAEAYRELGRRYAQAYFQLQAAKDSP